MKTILISGGLGHLSQDLIKSMKKNIYRFILIDIIQRTESTKNTTYIQADITNFRRLDKELRKLYKKRPFKLDGIVNTPAWSNFKNLNESSPEDIQRIIDTKLVGYTNMIKSAFQYLDKGASIVNIGSVQAHSTRGGTTIYSAANGGLISLTKALAIEYRACRIRVNIVSPGSFDSKIYKETHPDWKENVRCGRCLSTKYVSEVIKFLLSNKSRGINGSEIIVDGGLSALRASANEY